jgi:hypothetical protein
MSGTANMPPTHSRPTDPPSAPLDARSHSSESAEEEKKSNKIAIIVGSVAGIGVLATCVGLFFKLKDRYRQYRTRQQADVESQQIGLSPMVALGILGAVLGAFGVRTSSAHANGEMSVEVIESKRSDASSATGAPGPAPPTPSLTIPTSKSDPQPPTLPSAARQKTPNSHDTGGMSNKTDSILVVPDPSVKATESAAAVSDELVAPPEDTTGPQTHSVEQTRGITPHRVMTKNSNTRWKEEGQKLQAVYCSRNSDGGCGDGGCVDELFSFGRSLGYGS